jgi:hypothetical protein
VHAFFSRVNHCLPVAANSSRPVWPDGNILPSTPCRVAVKIAPATPEVLLLTLQAAPVPDLDVQPVKWTTTPPANVALLIVPVVVFAVQSSLSVPLWSTANPDVPVKVPLAGLNSGPAKAVEVAARPNAKTATDVKPANRAIFIFSSP